MTSRCRLSADLELRLGVLEHGEASRTSGSGPTPPASRCAKIAASCALVAVERTRVTTSTPESPGIPARNGFNGFLRNRPAIPSRQNAAASTASHPASVTIMIRPNPSGEIVMGGQPFFNMRTSYTRFCGKRMARARILQNLDSRNFALCEKKSEVQCDSLQRRRKKVTKHDQ
jgi:hypothetical protein